MDSTERFTSRVADYVRYRPSYPRQVIETIWRVAGLKEGSTVADIGSGTGIFTGLLLEAGAEVYAVEPNAAMRGAAELAYSENRRFHSVIGTGEATTLPSDSVSAVTCAQAWHWMDPNAAKSECARILRPGGCLFLTWNDRELTGSRFAEGYEQILIDLAPEYTAVRHADVSAKQLEAVFAPHEMKAEYFPNSQWLNYESFAGRVLSSSYAPHKGNEGHERFMSSLRALFDECEVDGQVEMRYNTELFYGQLK